MRTSQGSSISFERLFRYVAGLFVLLLLSATVALPVQAQTPITTVENGEGDLRFEVNHNGSLLAPGELVTDGTENDSIPATGKGTRMMWYPAKAAIRAGEVGEESGNEDLWDASNVGEHSVAFGRDTEASGDHSIAMGDRTTANAGFGAMAIGARTTASDIGATALGYNTEASRSASTAMGNSTTAATSNSLSIGECNDTNRNSDGTLFVVGNGSFSTETGECGGYSDALVLEDDGFGGGDLTVNGDVEADNISSSSDRRLKTDVESLSDGTLEALAHIRPVRFQFKDEETHPSGEQFGVIAQEVREVFPELVSEGSDGYLSVAYPKLSAVLLKGVQEQQSTIETQRERIDRLEEQQNEMAEQVAALRAERSAPAGWAGPGAGLLAGLVLGGVLGASLLWRRR